MVAPVNLGNFNIEFPRDNPRGFQQMTAVDFIRRFPQDYDTHHFIATGEAAASEEKPIVSFEIGDCITVFGIHKNQGQIEGIAAYHAQSQTSLATMKEMLEDYFYTERGLTEIYLIGGTEESMERGGLLEVIHQGLEQALEGKYQIVEEKINLPGESYISASLTMEGKLAYCMYNN